MFVFIDETEEQIIEWPVTVELAVSGGKIKKQEFIGHFVKLPEADLKEMIEEAKRNEDPPESQRPNEDAIRFFGKILRGWDKITNKAGVPIEYSELLLEKMLTGTDGTAFALGLWRAQGQIRTGAKAKN